MQLLSVVDDLYPPHSMFPDWTWAVLPSGSGGSSHVEFCQGLNNSADCSAPPPPVIRMASEMKRFVLSGIYQHKQDLLENVYNEMDILEINGIF